MLFSWRNCAKQPSGELKCKLRALLQLSYTGEYSFFFFFFFASSILISVNFPNELTEDVITGKAADPTKKSN